MLVFIIKWVYRLNDLTSRIQTSGSTCCRVVCKGTAITWTSDSFRWILICLILVVVVVFVFNFLHFIWKGQSQVLWCRVCCANGINSIVDMLAKSQFDLASLVSKELYYWLFMSMQMTFARWGKCL